MAPSFVLMAFLATTVKAITGQLGDAVAIQDNPQGAAYIASFFPNKNSNVSGAIIATSGPGGKGVNFNINLKGFPSQGGPFIYHIHTSPVPDDGNCTQTMAHLDPFLRGEDPPCDPKSPATCQVGDLSGKFGMIEKTPFTTSYTDDYVALKEETGAFLGNRSVVIHLADKTRIACANFYSLSDGINEDCTSLGFGDDGGDDAGGDDGEDDDPSSTKTGSIPVGPTGGTTSYGTTTFPYQTGTATSTMTGMPSQFTGAAAKSRTTASILFSVALVLAIAPSFLWS